MIVKLQKSFTSQYKKLSTQKKQLAKDALLLFGEDPMSKDLRNHPLKEPWVGYRSITADNDLRLHYRLIGKNTALFVAIGSHDELYK